MDTSDVDSDVDSRERPREPGARPPSRGQGKDLSAANESTPRAVSRQGKARVAGTGCETESAPGGDQPGTQPTSRRRLGPSSASGPTRGLRAGAGGRSAPALPCRSPHTTTLSSAIELSTSF